jgi:hypothetical protein
MKNAGLDLTVEGDIQRLSGCRISHSDGTGLSHTALILLIRSLRPTVASPWYHIKQTPAAVNQLLRRCSPSEDFDGHFHLPIRHWQVGLP